MTTTVTRPLEVRNELLRTTVSSPPNPSVDHIGLCDQALRDAQAVFAAGAVEAVIAGLERARFELRWARLAVRMETDDSEQVEVALRETP